MNSFAIPPLISSILFLLLGLFVFFRNKTSRTNISFALMCLTTVWWQGSWTVLFSITNPRLATLLVRIGYSGIIFIPITFYHFTIEFLKKENEKHYVWLCYILGFLFLASTWTTDIFIGGYYRFSWGYYPRASFILHPFYLFMLTAQSFRMLYLLYTSLKLKQLDPFKNNQIKYFFWALFFYICASMDFLTNYGVPLYPLGFVFILIFTGIIAYTIAKFRLLDIHFVIRKTITNSIWIFIISCLLCAINCTNLNLLQVILNIMVSTFLVFQIPKLIKVTDKFITHLLYKGKYDYLDKLDIFISKMILIPEEEELIEKTIEALIRYFDIDTAILYLMNPVSHEYIVKYKQAPSESENIVIPEDSAIVTWLNSHKDIFVYEEVQQVMSIRRFNNIFENIIACKVKICIPLMKSNELLGFIALGDKKSGEMYNHIDLELCERLCTQLTVALDYRNMESRLRNEQELSAMGIMAMEIGHEMRNLLVAPFTFIDMLDYKKDDPEFMSSFKDMAMDRLRVIRGKLDDIMYFGKQHTLKLDPGLDIHKLLDDTILGNDYIIKKCNVTIEKQYGEIPLLRADHNHLVHLFNNLMLNSVDAMAGTEKKGGKLYLSTEKNKSVTAEMKARSNQWIRIKVTDSGEGIPDHIKAKLFTPFVTTKSAGVGAIQRKGTGLGLSVVKKAVDAHKGYIYVQSEYGKGTTMVVDLPVDLKEDAIIQHGPITNKEPWEYKK